MALVEVQISAAEFLRIQLPRGFLHDSSAAAEGLTPCTAGRYISRGGQGSHIVVQNCLFLHAARQEYAWPASAALRAERAKLGEFTFADAPHEGVPAG